MNTRQNEIEKKNKEMKVEIEKLEMDVISMKDAMESTEMEMSGDHEGRVVGRFLPAFLHVQTRR